MWWLVGVVALLLAFGALAWWTSGRARPLGRDYGDDLGGAAADAGVVNKAAGYSPCSM